jgi:MerR family transcriptional regulator, mercuric resistance operon regulatory protein
VIPLCCLSQIGATAASPKASNNDRRTIGRLAREAGVNVETIRFYERRGLLRQPKTPANGWRTYDESAVWVIHYIKLGQQLGFTLGEMKKLLAKAGSGKSFCASVQRAYEDKIELLGKKIEQLKKMRKELKKALAACVQRSTKGECPIAERCSGQIVVPISEIRTRRHE